MLAKAKNSPIQNIIINPLQTKQKIWEENFNFNNVAALNKTDLQPVSRTCGTTPFGLNSKITTLNQL